jgi:hypothetical protein
MFAKLKAALAGLTGGSGRGNDGPPADTVDYKGFRIKPAPYRTDGGVFQTAGTIEQDGPEGVRTHQFIRADTHASREDAIAFAVAKAKQIIDLQGDRIFS